jgi:hypothetical protein
MRIMIITLLFLFTSQAMAKTTCDEALVACKRYVDSLEADNKLLHTHIQQLNNENNELISQVKKEGPAVVSNPLLFAGGVGLGGAAVAIGAPVVAIVLGAGALVLALIGVK